MFVHLVPAAGAEIRVIDHHGKVTELKEIDAIEVVPMTLTYNGMTRALRGTSFNDFKKQTDAFSIDVSGANGKVRIQRINPARKIVAKIDRPDKEKIVEPTAVKK
jgi:hypothetical protein